MSECFVTDRATAAHAVRDHRDMPPRLLTRGVLDQFLWKQIELSLGAASPSRAAIVDSLLRDIVGHS